MAMFRVKEDVLKWCVAVDSFITSTVHKRLTSVLFDSDFTVCVGSASDEFVLQVVLCKCQITRAKMTVPFAHFQQCDDALSFCCEAVVLLVTWLATSCYFC